MHAWYAEKNSKYNSRADQAGIVKTDQEELERNGSPAATFETDTGRQSVCVTIPVHFIRKQINEDTD